MPAALLWIKLSLAAARHLCPYATRSMDGWMIQQNIHAWEMNIDPIRLSTGNNTHTHDNTHMRGVGGFDLVRPCAPFGRQMIPSHGMDCWHWLWLFVCGRHGGHCVGPRCMGRSECVCVQLFGWNLRVIYRVGGIKCYQNNKFSQPAHFITLVNENPAENEPLQILASCFLIVLNNKTR